MTILALIGTLLAIGLFVAYRILSWNPEKYLTARGWTRTPKGLYQKESIVYPEKLAMDWERRHGKR